MNVCDGNAMAHLNNARVGLQTQVVLNLQAERLQDLGLCGGNVSIGMCMQRCTAHQGCRESP